METHYREVFILLRASRANDLAMKCFE